MFNLVFINILFCTSGTNINPTQIPISKVSELMVVDDLERLKKNQIQTLENYTGLEPGKDVPGAFAWSESFSENEPFDFWVQSLSLEEKEIAIAKLSHYEKNPREIVWTNIDKNIKEFSIEYDIMGRENNDIFYTERDKVTFVCTEEKPESKHLKVIGIKINSKELSSLGEIKEKPEVKYGFYYNRANNI